MESLNTIVSLTLLAAVVVMAIAAYVAVIILYRITRMALSQSERTRSDLMKLTETMLTQLKQLQRDGNTVTTELLAHRTLVETGNQVLAGEMLHHGNAHDHRATMPEVFTPPLEPNEDSIHGPHQSLTLIYGDMDEEPPLPGEES